MQMHRSTRVDAQRMRPLALIVMAAIFVFGGELNAAILRAGRREKVRVRRAGRLRGAGARHLERRG